MPTSTKRHEQPKDTHRSSTRLWLEAFAERHELALVLCLCVFAAVRVFLFAAAFPPFNNVDEFAHFDTVCHYAKGEVPAELVHFSEDAISMISLNGTPEYMSPPGTQMPPPIWSLPTKARQQVQAGIIQGFRGQQNTESTGPPLYYALAAAWYKLGGLLGLSGVWLFYWVRFINVWLYPLMMWCGYVCVVKMYPKTPLLRIGVPAMLAFFPQDVFYSVSNDVLSPLLFCVAFYLLARIYREDPKGYGLYALAGVTAAAAMLVKFSNVAILGVLAIVIIAMALRLRRDGQLGKGLPRLVVMILACAAPLSAWLIRNAVVLDDVTGSAAKNVLLQWTFKPASAIFDHPIFTPGGAFVFVRDLADCFWRGEVFWRASRLEMPAADALYWVTTVLFMAAAIQAVWKRSKKDGAERFTDWLGIGALAMSVMLLVYMSIAYDFGTCFYPSQAYPYVTSGRLMLGCLVPFLVLYIKGLDWLMTRLRLRFSRLAVLLIIALVSMISEIAISLDVFHSAYNWFHIM